MNAASGRRALVAGGASGFGLEIARRRQAAGAQVAIANASAEALAAARAELGDAVLAIPCDARSPARIDGAVQAAVHRVDGLDTLGISAGVIHIKPHAEVEGAGARANPLCRNATPADVAAATLWFVADEAAFLTGVALDVDGGAHLGVLPGA